MRCEVMVHSGDSRGVRETMPTSTIALPTLLVRVDVGEAEHEMGELTRKG